jgi:hypothetical protein
MSDEHRGGREPGRRGGLWLLAGAVAGAAVTAGAVAAGSSLLGSAEAAVAFDPPRFVEVSATAGIEHVYDGELAFFVGGGVAVFDCDGDQKPDVYLAGGSNPASLHRNVSDVGGALRFTPAPSAAAELTGVAGAYPIDIDGDTLIDLAVLRVGENVLLRGTGDCTFTRANEEWSFDGGDAWTVAFSAQWEDPRSLPTLAFGSYGTLDQAGERVTGCDDHAHFRPDGEAYAPPETLEPGWCTLSILFSDWDRSGHRDLRMTNDRHYYRDGQEQLWRIRPGAPPRLYTEEDGWQPMQIWGMGIASHDVTGDGTPEVFLTSQGDNKLQALAGGEGEPRYEDIAFDLGVTAHRPYQGDATYPSTAWHPELADVNNDGLIDLFITKGNVEAQPDHAAADPNNLLMGDSDGAFSEVAPQAGVADDARSRGAALADLNLDGMLDLVVVERRETVKLWRNVGWGTAGEPAPMGHWLALRVEQPGPNRGGIGSWIEVRAGGRVQRRELTIGGGHAGGQLGWLHFGLGPSEAADVRVVWPDGDEGPWMPVEADTFAFVERGEPQATPWSPERASG